MARGDASHGGRGRGRWIGVLLVFVLVTGAAATWRLDLYDEYAAPRLDEWFDDWFGDEPETPTEPAAIAPPAGLQLPVVGRPPAVADPVGTAPLSAVDVRRALAPYLRDRDLGRHVVAAVAPLEAGPPVFASGTGLAIPASTTKLVTATAALLALGPDHTFETSVVAGGPRRVVLVGGGDPYLMSGPADDETPYPARGDVVSLARATAATLQEQGRRRVTVGYDDSLFTGPAGDPTWENDYVPDGVVSPITALWVDQGRSPTGFGRVSDPALTAATVFAGALAEAGIKVVGEPVRGVAADSGETLASVESAPLSQIVERILEVSDNEGSEVLLRHVGAATVGQASFAGGQRGVEQVLGEHGVPFGRTALHDGSGLSRANRIAPDTLIAVLRLATSADLPDLRPVLTGMPVAGFSGSLSDRFDGPWPEARGRVRAKTGTLTGVHTLAGIAVGPDGVPMLFALMTDRVRLPDNLEAETTIDNAAAALGACRCGA